MLPIPLPATSPIRDSAVVNLFTPIPARAFNESPKDLMLPIPLSATTPIRKTNAGSLLIIPMPILVKFLKESANNLTPLIPFTAASRICSIFSAKLLTPEFTPSRLLNESAIDLISLPTSIAEVLISLSFVFSLSTFPERDLIFFSAASVLPMILLMAEE